MPAIRTSGSIIATVTALLCIGTGLATSVHADPPDASRCTGDKARNADDKPFIVHYCLLASSAAQRAHIAGEVTVAAATEGNDGRGRAGGEADGNASAAAEAAIEASTAEDAAAAASDAANYAATAVNLATGIDLPDSDGAPQNEDTAIRAAAATARAVAHAVRLTRIDAKNPQLANTAARKEQVAVQTSQEYFNGKPENPVKITELPE
ncbi:hypothetical protein NONI108955_18110 [Nocardia ninae]|uniref:hypothetical protein n=1 Tax=Nocardia ninae TaxID=356145 RepID=UPI0011BE9FE1|nr:hypothetical protein [Nocardia ninae]